MLQLVNALERAQTEVKSSRKYIDSLREQVDSKEARIAELNKKDALAAQAIESLQNEIANLKKAIEEATIVMETRSKEVAKLKADLDKTRKKLKRARAVEKYLTIAAAAILAAFILK